jgi:hypothetical protein
MSSSEGGGPSDSASDVSSSGVDARSTASDSSVSSSRDGALEAGIDGGVDGAAEGGESGAVAASGEGGTAVAGCADKTYKLCEDFNTGTVGQLPAEWTLQKSYGAESPQNAALATDEFHSPPMSLKAEDLGMSGAARALRSLAGLGATASKHWGRIFYKMQLPAPKPASGVIQNTWVSLIAGQGDTQVVDTVENADGKHQWIYISGGDSCGFGSDYDWTFDDTWHCAEWYIDGPEASSYRFFFDSMAVTSSTLVPPPNDTCTEVASGFTGVVVGSLTYAPPAGPRVMWLDDLAIDDNRIGCN